MRKVWAISAVLVLAAAACGDDGSSDTAAAVIDPGDGGAYAPQIEPADFVSGIDNPYLPFVVGATWSYEGTDAEETEVIDVVVLEETREVMGVEATVVRDTVTDADGELIEDTYDWYAQDSDGNVWYLGEESTEYEGGEAVSTAGSWEAGVDGALPGIIMPADPQVGDAYRQEYYEGEAEDVAEVARTAETATVAYGSFDDLLVITEWNPFEPDIIEEKYYAEGIGVVLEQKTAGEEGRVELVTASVPG